MRTHRRILALVLTLLLPSWVWAQAGAVRIDATRNDATTGVQHSHTSAATITVPGVTGQFVYVTGIEISNCAGAAAVVAAAPTYITTTSFTGNPQWQVGSGVAAGLCQPVHTMTFATPLKMSTGSASATFVLPTFATNQTISVNVYYYTAP